MGDFLSGNFYTLTNIGKVRAVNEDFADARLNAFGHLFLIVADGMGGQNCGDFASQTIGKGLIKDFLDYEKPFTSPKQVSKWLYKAILMMLSSSVSCILPSFHSCFFPKLMGTAMNLQYLFSRS